MRAAASPRCTTTCSCADRRKAELFAAVAGEKEAVAAWRELVAVAGDRYAFDLAMGARNFDLCGHWRDELAKLEANLQKLEEQCGPPDDAASKEAVWTPAQRGDLTPPPVEHERVAHRRRSASPLRIVARVTDPSGVKSVRLRYRHVTQYEDYATLDMQPTGRPDEYAATIPGEFLEPTWDAMYFIEAIDGRQRRDLAGLPTRAAVCVREVAAMTPARSSPGSPTAH